MNDQLSIFGSSGFIGNNYCSMFGGIKIERASNVPKSNNILYFISTTDNYNVFTAPFKDIDTNLTKLIKVLEECKTNKNTIFNFVSSWFVYGKNSSLNTKETDLCDPTGFYSITKLTAEKLLMSYCQTYDLKYRIFRLTNIVGIGDRGVSPKKNAIQYMIEQLKENKPIKIYDNGQNIRDYMDVQDTCRAINVCIKNMPYNEIVNISNFEPKTIGEIIKYSKNKLNSKSLIESIDPPHFHKIVQIKDVALNNDKLKSYGYIPSINTIEAIDKILNVK
jgi:nucleoside-diphosphate-sugar epimerase